MGSVHKGYTKEMRAARAAKLAEADNSDAVGKITMATVNLMMAAKAAGLHKTASRFIDVIGELANEAESFGAPNDRVSSNGAYVETAPRVRPYTRRKKRGERA